MAQKRESEDIFNEELESIRTLVEKVEKWQEAMMLKQDAVMMKQDAIKKTVDEMHRGPEHTNCSGLWYRTL